MLWIKLLHLCTRSRGHSMFLLFSIFFAFLLFSWAQYKVKLAFQHGSAKQNRIYLSIGIGVLLLLACFRGLNVGNDTQSYYHLFLYYTGQESTRNMSADALRWISGIETGYKLLNKYFGMVTHNYQIFISFVAVLSYWILGRFIEKYSTNVALSLILAFLMFYGAYMNLLRQVLALSIVLISFDALNKNKRWRFAVGVLIAAFLFHRSAIICILLLPMSKYKCSKRFVWISIGISMIIVGLGKIPSIISFLNITTRYTDIEAGSSIIFSIAKNSGILLFSWYLNNKKWKRASSVIAGSQLNNDVAENLTSWLPFINLTISVCALGMPVATRFELYFSIFLIVLIPRMVTLSTRISSNIKVVVDILVFALLLYNTGKIIYRPEWVTEYNYSFFWTR